MTNDGNYPPLHEYPLESNFLELIPARAQRGISIFDLEFTCLDVDGPYMAIGSNVGVVYLFNREKGCMRKLKDNEHRSPITSVKVLISLECLVAIGFREGFVVVYKVPFEEEEELEKFTVEGLHECSITALEWAKNGMKFFSGDESGMVVCTEIDHLEHQSRSRLLMNDKTKIVQLSYSHLNLVISTLFRSLIYCTKTNTTYQIGQKERKCFGPFGAFIFENDESSSVFASRSGQRLWKSDMSGVIQETMIFKNALMTSHPTIRTALKSNQNPCFTDFPFERLARYDSYIVVWCETYILVIDPIQKLLVATSPKLDPIIDVATCNNEIFVLRGVRHVMRLSSEPDAYSNVKVSEEPSLFEEILVPFKELGTFVKGRSDSLAIQIDSNPTIFDWLRKKRSASTPVDFSADVLMGEKLEVVSAGSETLPDIVSLGADDCIPVRIDELSTTVIDTPEIATKDLSKMDESDDIVFKVKKKTKKPKKVHFAVDAAPKREKYKFKQSKDSKVESNYNEPNSIQADNVSDIVESIEATKSLEKDENTKSEKEKNGNNDSESIISNVSNTSDSSSESDVISNSTENNANIDCTDSSIFNVSNIKIAEKADVDTDKLLEDVLSAYSHLKHQDVSNDDSEKSPEICDSDEKEIPNSNVNNNSNLNLNISQVSENADIENLTGEKSPDADDIYKSLLTTGTESHENPKLKELEDSLESESLEESSTSLDSKKDEPPKYGVDWLQYRAPELLLDLSVSNDHIFCVDVRNQMYFSQLPRHGTLKWVELDQPAEKVAVSDSESVVWALYRGTVFAALQKTATLWQNTEWISIARDVVSIAVDDACGWYAKSNGELLSQQKLTSANPYSYPESVYCSSPALQVAVRNGVVWVLTVGGSLLTKKVTDARMSKKKWKEIALKNIPGIDSIFLGSQKTGWIIDANGMIRFVIGVTPETPEGTGEPWLVEASTYQFRATSQLEQVVRRALNSEALTNLIRGKQHLCLSTSDNGVWFCKTYDNLLYSNQRCIIGHMWELVVPPSTAIATKWSLIAADGINNSDGVLWCVNSSGELFCYDTKSRSLVPVELPSASGVRCLQPKYQSLWLLSEDGTISVRRGITPNCLQGIWWQPLDLLQLGSQKVIHISCSSFVSWACTEDGEVLMRMGYLNPSSSKLNQAWISIGPANEEAASPLVKVYVGPLGYPVWAVDRKQNVYVRERVTPSLPIGEKWASVPDMLAKELCITNNAVWLQDSSGKIYRRFGVTEKNLCGDYWKQIPGDLDFLSATEDDDIWGIQNGSMFCHYSFVLYNTLDNSKKTPARMISEDDWEDIMADDLDEDI